MSLTALTKCYCALKERVDALASTQSPTLTTTTTPIYEYRDIWAEESSALTNNSDEWSFGNGATGFIGLPIGENWELMELYFHADTYAANTSIQVDFMNYGNTPSSAAANTVASISLANAADGGGATNNAYKIETFATPIALQDNKVYGFLTRSLTGAASDARVGARLRRKVGDVVTSVTLS